MFTAKRTGTVVGAAPALTRTSSRKVVSATDGPFTPKSMKMTKRLYKNPVAGFLGSSRDGSEGSRHTSTHSLAFSTFTVCIQLAPPVEGASSFRAMFPTWRESTLMQSCAPALVRSMGVVRSGVENAPAQVCASAVLMNSSALALVLMPAFFGLGKTRVVLGSRLLPKY